MSEWMVSREARDIAIENAREEGYVVVYGNAKTIQLDIDNKTDFNNAINMLETFQDGIGITGISYSLSKNGNIHIYLSIARPLERHKRLFLQAVLGSDRKREALNWIWMEQNENEECFLIECSSIIPVTLKQLKNLSLFMERN